MTAKKKSAADEAKVIPLRPLPLRDALKVVFDAKGEFGIDNLKSIIDEVAQAFTTVKTAFQTKNWFQLVQLALQFSRIQTMIEAGVFKKAVSEIRDLDSKESAEISAYFLARYPGINPKIDEALENFVALVPRTYSWIVEGIALFEDWRDMVEGVIGKDETGIGERLKRDLEAKTAA